jgi:Uma2 family endonuclease
MGIALIQSIQKVLAMILRERRFNVAEYELMIEAGVFPPSERLELLEGRLVPMSPIGSEHSGCVNFLSYWFMQHVSTRALVSIHNPVVLSDESEPEPDILLLKPRVDWYRKSKPRVADLLAVIEVCDTTVNFDRDVKLPLYAQALVPEVWLVVLPEKCVEVYTQSDGVQFQSCQTYRAGESIPLSFFSDLHFPASEAFE